MIDFIYDDGGRANAGFRGEAGDCSTRAISIATGKPYREVYDDLTRLGNRERITKRHPSKGSARAGVRMSTLRKYLAGLGWEWVSTMTIGSGCQVHLRSNELPNGRLIVRVSRHLCAVIDGVIRDTHDPSRGGERCVYGYWRKR
jgi:hypothetical protein